MLEAVHVGRLAPISQHGASEAQVEVDTGQGQLVGFALKGKNNSMVTG